MRFLTDDLRRELKSPLGLLIRGSFKHTMERLQELVTENKPKKLISVGDRVSKSIIEKRIPLDIIIVDNKIMRKPIVPIKFKAKKTLRVINPAGTLSDEVWQVIKEAIDFNGQVKVLVEGEEDLLTLVAVLLAPENSFVVYGQPKEGIVAIKVTEDAKRKIREIVDRMEEKPTKPEKVPGLKRNF